MSAYPDERFVKSLDDDDIIRPMKPAPFEYVIADSLEGVLSLMGQYGSEARPLAGGQSLIPAMNFRLARPAVLVDLNRVNELDYIRPTTEGGLRIGAMTRQYRLERDGTVARLAPLLYETIPFVAHPQIRNRGTLGGSLAHADPAAELPVVAVALQARLRLQSARGERWLPAGDFFTGLFSTALQSEEILTEIELPPLPPRSGWAFMEVSRRHGDYAQAGVAVLLTLKADGRCQEVRLVYLNVGEGPICSGRAVALLQDQFPTPALFQTVAEVAASSEIAPVGDIHASADYKCHLIQVLTGRALAQALSRAQQNLS